MKNTFLEIKFQIILFIAVLDSSHTVDYIQISNYEKIPNIDQDIHNFIMHSSAQSVPGVPKMGSEKWAVGH